MNKQLIQWYPGHIAKAEKQLKEHLNKVDLVFEVRDARIPLATSHPYLQKWLRGKKQILVINRKDMINIYAHQAWDKKLRADGKVPWWCDAKAGTGIHQLKQAAIRAGQELNQRRLNRGMKNRAIRVLTLGFPNVGKSALINRLVKKKVVSSSRKAGVTRSLRWVRLGQDLDLLDAPGVLPPRLEDQNAALKLAICDDIGQAAYDTEQVAIKFLSLLEKLEENKGAGIQSTCIQNRYGIYLNKSIKDKSSWLLSAAERHTSGDTLRMSQRLLDDFRKNLLGNISLELP
ncbi:ribosome biogenesis GTPase YlqF [Prochlorococcus marinus]|uniref:Ribosome biogenesis GTPase A n=1 Tax=Prochlorococcus marinus XMU1408 TaxID=2213228 RepID=A0A318R4D0_PROMR|nr:ribosome biogenesis GTPase YlqF [Prochlorococcus marinus]MBW3041255.1 ribosome biogenesis GTPase YlqF [Prochlorococcus marinus str. XMU1408]PYE03844.1 ribosome biogenesis GTPase YlqF [Prochlorococcus marinus XMU1408]